MIRTGYSSPPANDRAPWRVGAGMTRRKLRPEELELWRRVTSSLQPLRSPRPVPPAPVPPPEPHPPHPPRPVPPDQRPPDQLPRAVRAPDGGRSEASSRRMPPFRIGEAARPAPASSPATEPPRIDASTLRAMKRGRRAPEGRIDLHGLTLAEAHAALTGFLLGARAEGRRLVLVITGKGGRGANGSDTSGALRREVPFWLARPPLAAVIQDVLPAHHRHGGAGALYVYLRRSRS